MRGWPPFATHTHCAGPAAPPLCPRTPLHRWLDKLQQQQQIGTSGGGGGAAATVFYLVIDVSDSSAEIMDSDGETLTVHLPDCPLDLAGRVRSAWEEGLEVRVALSGGGGIICAVETS